ncbi:ARC6/PARC6 family protein [Pseudanabaena sp. FACHB-1277]|uniref:ARC6/PARC6 family protein n=2 Tax=Pseudanabaena TaxID=1152 RepID=A0A926Z5Z9_9CYAN|nr:ARC6/PARC6 family protein [Pseudanabaena cinerea FACHB-1277]
MPRREYSDAAIASRKRIIDKAYETLTDANQTSSDPELAETGNTQTATAPLPPQIEADEKDFAGLLLILYELGESEKVLNIARPYYDPEEAEYQSPRVSPHDPDLLLSVSLSYLDLGRESWKQGQYEAAADALESAQEILLREGLFLSIRSEIQADLFRLRPYRILELLSAPDNQTNNHRKGLLLLQEMLDARRGIDGSGNDYSGLGIDDFLRFIQQLRSYMTTLEQQTLFEEEARRPSSVATYLAVYALIARGFSQRQPALIRRAKGLLVKLSARQDIYLEKAVCALLLGQTEEASIAIDNSAEDDQVAFIRQNSEGAPDLLPGLCLYSERWLQEEVYPHFRDLMNQIVSLKDYFADDQVQSYLEELPNTSAISSEWTAPVGGGLGLDEGRSRRENRGNFASASGSLSGNSSVNLNAETSAANSLDTANEQRLTDYSPEPPTRFQRSNAPLISRSSAANNNGRGELPRSPRTGHVPPPRSKNINEAVREIKRPSPNHAPSVPTAPKRKFNTGRLAIVIAIAIALIGGTFTLVVWAINSLMSPTRSRTFVPLEKPITTLAQSSQAPQAAAIAQSGPLNKETATRLIETWQATKSKALGNTYEENILEEILTEPALSDWRSRAKELKASNSYLQYQTKSTRVDQVIADGETKAKVIAKISESRNFFSNGELDSGASKADANYTVEYDLVRKDNKWLIREMLVF